MIPRDLAISLYFCIVGLSLIAAFAFFGRGK